jgi:hypothetical protein
MATLETAECTLLTCPVEASIYSYRPSLPANATLLTLFALSGIIHSGQWAVWRTHSFSAPIIVGCVSEVIGYVGRILSYDNPFGQVGFLTQICCITIAPAFYTAAIYFTIGDIVKQFGVEASRLKPNAYAYIFIPCDIVSLVLQGTGGGMASVAAQTGTDPDPGTNIMVAGLAFQVFSLSVFMIFTGEFAWRARRWRSEKREEGGNDGGEDVEATELVPTSKRRLVLFSSFFFLGTICIFTRCVFRCVELSEGWTGPLIKDEVTYIALEGV